MIIKVIGHYSFALFLAVGLCASAYGFLSAYALKLWQQERLSAHQIQLNIVNRQHQELVRKSAILKKAAQFADRARSLGLQPDAWTLYDVNVQAPLAFEAAQEIVYLCSDSTVAYYWPISLEIKAQHHHQDEVSMAKAQPSEPMDVQLTVKGRFAARR